MLFEKSDVIAMQLGYVVEFVGGVMVLAILIMFARDFIVKRWNERTRATN